MTSNELKHQANIQKWASVIQECRSSGVPVKQWCREQGIGVTTYYRWEREMLGLAGRLQEKPRHTDTVAFAELPAPRKQCHTAAEQAATVRIQDISIDIYPNMNGELLKSILEAIHLC